MNRRLIGLLAFACGATVANLYYAQPLLPEIADAFHVSKGTAGLLVTVTQVSYAIGLVFIVPLGDLLQRQTLVTRLLAVCCVALAAAAAAPSLALLAVALGVAALTSVVVQILTPFASTLAPPEERGRVLGVVVGGALIGILIARTVSGLVAGVAGWRAPFVVAAVVIGLLAVTLRIVLPRVPPPSDLPYRRLLVSVVTLVRTEPILRRRMVYGGLGLAQFSLVWTTIAFLLAGDPYNYGESTIGLFGLAGLLGAVAARRFGHLRDGGHAWSATGAALILLTLSWVVLGVGRSSVVAVAFGLALLDFAVQGQNVLSQGEIYGRLGSEHASRIATAYVGANFVGGALGSLIGSVAYNAGGWSAVWISGVAIAAVSVAFWATEARTHAGRGAVVAK